MYLQSDLITSQLTANLWLNCPVQANHIIPGLSQLLQNKMASLKSKIDQYIGMVGKFQ